MVPVPSSNSLKVDTYPSREFGDSFHCSWSCVFSKFSMMTAVNRLSMIMDTAMTKDMKYGYDTQLPFASGRLQSCIRPTHSSFVATRNRVSMAVGKDSKFACSLMESALTTVPNVRTPT